MDYTELINNIKNKLKVHQDQIDTINNSINLETKIKNDLETNFKKRVNYILVSNEASQDLVNISNELEENLKKYEKNKKEKIQDYKLSFIIKDLRKKQKEKLSEFKIKKKKVAVSLTKRIEKLNKNIEIMTHEVDTLVNTYVTPALNNLEHLKRLKIISKYTDDNNKKSLLDIQFKIRSEYNNLKNESEDININANIQKENLKIQLELLNEGLETIKKREKSLIPSGIPKLANTSQSSSPFSTPKSNTSNTSYKSSSTKLKIAQIKSITKNDPDAIKASKEEDEIKRLRKLVELEKKRKDRLLAESIRAAEKIDRKKTHIANLQKLAIDRKKDKVIEVNRAVQFFIEAEKNKIKYKDELSNKRYEEAHIMKIKAESDLLEEQYNIKRLTTELNRKRDAHKNAIEKAESDKLAAAAALATKLAAEKASKDAKLSKIKLEKSALDSNKASISITNDIKNIRNDISNANKSGEEAKIAKEKADKAVLDLKQKMKQALIDAEKRAILERESAQKALEKFKKEKELLDEEKAKAKAAREKAIIDKEKAVKEAKLSKIAKKTALNEARELKSERDRAMALKAEADLKAKRSREEKEKAELSVKNAIIAREKALKDIKKSLSDKLLADTDKKTSESIKSRQKKERETLDKEQAALEKERKLVNDKQKMAEDEAREARAAKDLGLKVKIFAKNLKEKSQRDLIAAKAALEHAEREIFLAIDENESKIANKLAKDARDKFEKAENDAKKAKVAKKASDKALALSKIEVERTAEAMKKAIKDKQALERETSELKKIKDRILSDSDAIKKAKLDSEKSSASAKAAAEKAQRDVKLAKEAKILADKAVEIAAIKLRENKKAAEKAAAIAKGIKEAKAAADKEAKILSDKAAADKAAAEKAADDARKARAKAAAANKAAADATAARDAQINAAKEAILAAKKAAAERAEADKIAALKAAEERKKAAILEKEKEIARKNAEQFALSKTCNNSLPRNIGKMDYQNLGTVYHNGNFRVSFTIKLNSMAKSNSWRNILMFKHKNFLWCTPAFYIWPNSTMIYPIIFNKNGLWVLLPKEMNIKSKDQSWDTEKGADLSLELKKEKKVELSIFNNNIKFGIDGRVKNYTMKQMKWGNIWLDKFKNQPIEVTIGIPEFKNNNYGGGDFGKPPDAEMKDFCFTPNYRP